MGRRTEILISPRANFELASRLQESGAPLAEVFSFLSGLYFRGKITYATHFARAYRKLPAVWVITSNRGLIPANTVVTAEDLRSQGEVPIDLKDKRYVEALKTSAKDLASKLPSTAEVVLLGSISTDKYVGLLLKIFESRLLFPPDFVGRGDMSRGGLLLRCAADDQELPYVPLVGAIRHGKRPPKLEPRRWK
jgi:hypothetical protein